MSDDAPAPAAAAPADSDAAGGDSGAAAAPAPAAAAAAAAAPAPPQQSERDQVLDQYRAKIREHREVEARLKRMREDVKGLVAPYLCCCAIPYDTPNLYYL